ncbi:MAG TPA: 1,4-alpha-glucan branching protein domain-containing protein [Gemmatimonadales bacterium]|nr:1,4-alpha-glucan branching protein domain-containing protein [Gemmatimonadales bacterium]
MDFVLALHSHLPYVLNHGRWPHGSDWLCEAALDTYLPLLEQLEQLSAEKTPAPVTIGFTPVLANQLDSRVFAGEMDDFFAQRLAACDEGPSEFAGLVESWRARFRRLRALFHKIDGNLVGAFRRLEEHGSLEIIGSAATHGYLPLLARTESIRLQLAVGRAEHRRLFGVAPRGCWLPECAYRPGLEQQLADAGFRYFFTDAHLAHAGTPLRAYSDASPAEWRGKTTKSPYQAYRVSRRAGPGSVAALVRDPRSSMQIWSRHQGYPGDEWYLEFHKIRWPGGLKLWRVTGANVDLGGKRPYEPQRAFQRAADHASHFAHLLEGLPEGKPKDREGVIVAPFDTELFGHWWFEGPDFLAAAYRGLRGRGVRPVTASQHLEAHPPRVGLQLAEGSWGANGDHSMWLNDRTAWTWKRLRALEAAFWEAAPAALTKPAARPVLAQAARELLLAQSSDWQFIISTGAVVDYAERRFTLHCDDAERLIGALQGSPEERGGARLADELAKRDALFPDVLAAVKEAVGS